MLSAHPSESSNRFNQLPVYCQLNILSYLDLETLANTALVDTNLHKLETNALHNLYLESFNFSLWQHILKQTKNPAAGVDNLLFGYISEISHEKNLLDPSLSLIGIREGRNLRNTVTAPEFLDYLEQRFLKGIYPYSQDPKNLKLYSDYLGNFGVNAQGIIATVLRDVSSLHKQIENNEILTIENYQKLFDHLEKIKWIERTIITLLVCYENYNASYVEGLTIFLTEDLVTRLTDRDLWVLQIQLNILDKMKDAWEKIKQIEPNNLTNTDIELLRRIEGCFDKLSEETILNTFFYTNPPNPKFILICPQLLANISNLNLLRLTMATIGGVLHILFKSSEFRKRLSNLPDAGNILAQLVDGKVSFEDTVFSRPSNQMFVGNVFAEQILLLPEFISLLSDDQLLRIIGDKFTIEKFNRILRANQVLVERLIASPTLLSKIIDLSRENCCVIATYQLDSEHSLIDHLNLSQAANLALKERTAVERVLNNSQISNHIWERHYLDQLRREHGSDIQPLIDFRMQEYQQFIARVESGDENSLKLLLKKAFEHLPNNVLLYKSYIKHLCLGLRNSKNTELVNEICDLFDKAFAQLSGESLVFLDAINTTSPILIENVRILANLYKRENSLSKFLIENWQFIRQPGSSKTLLFDIARHHPDLIIEAYQLKEIIPFDNFKLPVIFALSGRSTAIAQAFITNPVLHKKWMELKKATSQGLEVSEFEARFLSKYDDAVEQLTEDELIDAFKNNPEALKNCPYLLTHLSSDNPIIIELGWSGNFAVFDQLRQDAVEALERYDIKKYLMHMHKVYPHQHNLHFFRLIRKHREYLEKKPMSLLVDLALENDDCAVDIIIEQRDYKTMVSLEESTVKELSSRYTGGPVDKFVETWEKTKKEAAVRAEQKEKLAHIFEKLDGYQRELDYKIAACYDNKDKDGEKKYKAKSYGIGSLTKDLRAESGKYFAQDFYHPEIVDSKQLYSNLKVIIDDHFDIRKYPRMVAHTKWRTEVANYVITAIGWILVPPIMAGYWFCKHSPIFRFQTATEKFVKSDIKSDIEKATKTPSLAPAV